MQENFCLVFPFILTGQAFKKWKLNGALEMENEVVMQQANRRKEPNRK
jgi:hypothetical protein